ncbi:MAG: hypothetical protein ACSHWS_00660 [Sulfitobacter sp.]
MSSLADFLARPRKLGPRYIIDPVAFFLALIGGPLLFTLATFWMLFIPVMALGLGGFPYLIFGTPVLLIYLSRHPAKPLQLAGLALLTLFCLSICLSIGAAILQDEAVFALIPFILIFGAIFASAWAASFGWVYNKLCRDFYTQPLHT